MSSPINFNIHGTRGVKCPFGRLYKFFLTYEIINQQNQAIVRITEIFELCPVNGKKRGKKTSSKYCSVPKWKFSFSNWPSWSCLSQCSTVLYTSCLCFIASSCPVGYNVNWSHYKRPSLSVADLWVLLSACINIKFDQIFLNAQASLNWVFKQRNVVSYPSPLPFSLLTGLSIKTFCAEVCLCECNTEHT